MLMAGPDGRFFMPGVDGGGKSRTMGPFSGRHVKPNVRTGADAPVVRTAGEQRCTREDIENIGVHYARTLDDWKRRFVVHPKHRELLADRAVFHIDDEVILHRAVMTKGGIRLGEITLGFRKVRP